MRISLLTAAFVIIAAAVLIYCARREAALLRLDPAAIAMSSALTSFAAGRGKDLFELRCASCHGTHGLGDPGRGIPNLADEDWLYGAGSVGDIEQVVRFGIRSHHARSWNLAFMPAYGTPRPSSRDPSIAPLSPGALRDVVEYLVQVRGLPSDSAAALRGARVFAGIGGCYDCHAADAKGDSAIGAPNLTDRTTLYGDGSRASLTMSVALGRHGMCPAWEGRLSPAAIREVSVFVYSLSHSRSAP